MTRRSDLDYINVVFIITPDDDRRVPRRRPPAAHRLPDVAGLERIAECPAKTRSAAADHATGSGLPFNDAVHFICCRR